MNVDGLKMDNVGQTLVMGAVFCSTHHDYSNTKILFGKFDIFGAKTGEKMERYNLGGGDDNWAYW